jgi:hypothetical protein
MLKFRRDGWHFVENQTSICDQSSIITAKQFGLDVFREGMVHVNEHPPVLGGTVRDYDDKAALQRRQTDRETRPSSRPISFSRLAAWR